MPKSTKQELTDYIDASIDAQRAYAEKLFADSKQRVDSEVREIIEARLKTALSTMRPTHHEKPAPPSLRTQNALALATLERTLRDAAALYEVQSGLRVRAAGFGRLNGAVIVRVQVAN